jgi:hypothetical protein
MMPTLPAGLAVDVVRAESARFRHPLLLLHGLWTGSWIWGGFAGYLAHRGWESWAPSLGAVAEPAERLFRLTEICRSLPSPPVLVAHDVGIVTAAKLASLVAAPAIVAITPLLHHADGGDLGIFSHPRFWAARCGARRVGIPRGSRAGRLFGGASDVAERLRPDAGPVFRALLSGADRLPDPAPGPGLLVCAEGDSTLSASQGASVAGRIGWSFELHRSQGHFPMLAPGWELLADRVHRWLVRIIGEDLLALLDDESDDK